MRENKAILLDLGGVVLQPDNVLDPNINWRIINELNTKYESGEKYTFDDLYRHHNTLTGQSLTKTIFLDKIFSTLKVNEALVSIVRAYGDIIIVSDNYRESVNYIAKKYDFDRWSIKQVYSYDYKMVKSNPEFFKKLLKEVPQYTPENLLLIDDSPEKLKSAATVGIQGIRYENNTQIKDDLHHYFKNQV